ncbi:unnamed protein product [Moneuplotes crassus]|uniref:Uncharacterized protein n=1 Tax=Euplotes crassus TaxID=5936 RepID=A0AAD1XLE6_EUPCR|nr:unnamed protein product [Moneuplotes crassus]
MKSWLYKGSNRGTRNIFRGRRNQNKSLIGPEFYVEARNTDILGYDTNFQKIPNDHSHSVRRRNRESTNISPSASLIPHLPECGTSRKGSLKKDDSRLNSLNISRISINDSFNKLSTPAEDGQVRIADKTKFCLKKQLDPLRMRELLNKRILNKKANKEPNYGNIFENLVAKIPKKFIHKQKKPLKRSHNTPFTRASFCSMHYDIDKLKQDKYLASHFLRAKERRKSPKVRFMNKIIQSKNIGTAHEYINIKLNTSKKVGEYSEQRNQPKRIAFSKFRSRPLPQL